MYVQEMRQVDLHNQEWMERTTDRPRSITTANEEQLLIADVGLAPAAGKQEWCSSRHYSITWAHLAIMHLNWVLIASKLTQTRTTIERHLYNKQLNM